MYFFANAYALQAPCAHECDAHLTNEVLFTYISALRVEHADSTPTDGLYQLLAL